MSSLKIHRAWLRILHYYPSSVLRQHFIVPPSPRSEHPRRHTESTGKWMAGRVRIGKLSVRRVWSGLVELFGCWRYWIMELTWMRDGCTWYAYIGYDCWNDARGVSLEYCVWAWPGIGEGYWRLFLYDCLRLMMLNARWSRWLLSYSRLWRWLLSYPRLWSYEHHKSMNGLATGLYYKIYLFEPVARSFPFLSSSSSNQPPISKQQYLMTISHLKARIPIKTYFIKHHPTCVWNNAIYSLVGIRSFTQSPS